MSRAHDRKRIGATYLDGYGEGGEIEATTVNLPTRPRCCAFLAWLAASIQHSWFRGSQAHLSNLKLSLKQEPRLLNSQ